MIQYKRRERDTHTHTHTQDTGHRDTEGGIKANFIHRILISP